MTKLILSTVVICSFLLGCMSSQPTTMLPEGALTWSAERSLTWADFQGAAIKTDGQTVCQMAVNNPSLLSKSSLFSKSVVGFLSTFLLVSTVVESTSLAVSQMTQPLSQGFLALAAHITALLKSISSQVKRVIAQIHES